MCGVDFCVYGLYVVCCDIEESLGSPFRFELEWLSEQENRPRLAGQASWQRSQSLQAARAAQSARAAQTCPAVNTVQAVQTA